MGLHFDQKEVSPVPTKQPNLYGLTARQALFVSEYLKDLNGTQAAIRAGYSPKAAEVQASENLRKPKIQLARPEGQNAAEARSQVTVDRVLLELARVAFADTTLVAYVDQGRVIIRDTADLDGDTRRAISEISQSVGNTITTKVKMHDKIKALELLGRHLAMFKDKVDVDMQFSIPEILAELKRRRDSASGGKSNG